MVRVDIADATTIRRAMDGVESVLNCTEMRNAGVARIALERGIDYVDVSASPQVLTEIEELDGFARSRGARVALSVGLVPGVSNLLAALIAEEGERQVQIGVLLGTGEHHGRAAIDWTLRGLGQLHGSWTMGFPKPYGPRNVYAFPFSDQYTLPRTIGVGMARTGLCLDSRLSTEALRVLSRPTAERVLRRSAVKNLLLGCLTRVHLGDDRFVVSACTERAQATVQGRGQSRATGVIAALVLDQLSEFPPGVHHLEQIVQPAAFLADAAITAGLRFERCPEPHQGTR